MYKSKRRNLFNFCKLVSELFFAFRFLFLLVLLCSSQSRVYSQSESSSGRVICFCSNLSLMLCSAGLTEGIFIVVSVYFYKFFKVARQY